MSLIISINKLGRINQEYINKMSDNNSLDIQTIAVIAM